MLDVKVLVRVEEDVVAGLVIRIPEDRFEARPPQFVEVLALVDHYSIELVLRAQPLTGLHQGLRGHIGPEFPRVRVALLPEGDTGCPAKLAGDSVIVVGTVRSVMAGCLYWYVGCRYKVSSHRVAASGYGTRGFLLAVIALRHGISGA